MSIRIVAPPNDAVEVLSRAMAPPPTASFEVAALARSSHQALSMEAASNYEVVHPIYGLQLERILESDPLQAVELSGWRFVIENDQGQRIAASVHGSPGGALNPDPSINISGPYIQPTVELQSAILSNSSLTEMDAELRILQVAALNVLAFWLATESHQNDRLASLTSAMGGVEAGRLYSPDEFFGLLRPAAIEVLDSDTSVA